MGSRLMDKQERFCLEYVRTGVASEAYRLIYSAGRMSDKQVWEESSKLMANPKVAQRVAEIREEVTAPARKSLSIDKKWVLEQLVENVSMAKAAEPVLDGEGNPTGEYKQNLAAANKSLELIGKELGMFVDKKEIRTGAIDDIPHEDKMAALEAVRQEIARRKQVH